MYTVFVGNCKRIKRLLHPNQNTATNQQTYNQATTTTTTNKMQIIYMDKLRNRFSYLTKIEK